MLKFKDIINAQSVLKNVVKLTPLERSKSFSTMSEADVYLKLENFQTTGSFIVQIISGGNANMSILEQILDKGVMDEGLRASIQVLIPD